MVFSPAGKQLMSECELVLNTVTDDEPVRISSLDPQSSEISKKETAAEKKARLKAEKIAAAMALWEEDYEFKSNLEEPTFDQRPPYLSNRDVKDYSPVDFFELFFDNDVVTFICDQTNKFAVEKKCDRWDLITPEELRCFLGIVMLSGYNSLPSNRMFWEESEDVYNELVSSAMRRNRFLDILRFTHFCDNSDLDESDKLSKIRPLTNLIQERFHKFAFETSTINVDESMIEYFGKYGNKLKQRMPSKPIRSGYKVWALNLSDGYLHSFEVYQGKGSQSSFQAEFGHGPGVVLGLLENIKSSNYHVFIDNYFTSVNLLSHLAGKGIACTGTFNKKMLAHCPFPSDSEMGKKERGTFTSFVHKELNVQFTKWIDNKCVVMGSNSIPDSPPGECQRWSTSTKQYITIKRPRSIESCNSFMGGTDAMDQSINCYKPSIRNSLFLHLF